MSKLVLFIAQDRLFENGATEQFPCDLRDELRFSGRVGEQILVANVAAPFAEGFLALGYLAGFAATELGTTAVVSSVQVFPEPVLFPQALSTKAGLFELSDRAFTDVIEKAIGNEFSQATEDFWGWSGFDADLAQRYKNRCSFSASVTEQGSAFSIRPLTEGGGATIENFLFLDPAPGELFAHFAWTVGPADQIIVDAAAMQPDVIETISPTGRLVLPESLKDRPDPDALAWHFDQFVARIRSGQP